MRVAISIEKFNPETDSRPHVSDFGVDAHRGMTVLDALIRLKQEVDGTLSFRCSCRSAICGSCAMVINGKEKLACMTQINEEWERHQSIRLGPLQNLRVIKDLAVDMAPFWGKVRAITPWLESSSSPGSATPQEELTLLPETVKNFHNVEACIMCGACVAACTTLEVSKDFLGPAALAKAYRFMADPRENAKPRRLEKLAENDGIWDCVRCNFCVEVCPKDVKPMEAIIRLRRMALNEGVNHHLGARHIDVFNRIVRHEGRLNETLMPLGMLLKKPVRLLKVIPLALKMLLKGKAPSPIQKPIPGIKKIRELFQARENRT